MPRRRRAALANDVLHLTADRFQRDAEGLERFRGDSLTLVNEAEEDVLGSDVGVIQEARFLLRQNHNSASSVGKSFEHLMAALGDGE